MRLSFTFHPKSQLLPAYLMGSPKLSPHCLEPSSVVVHEFTSLLECGPGLHPLHINTFAHTKYMTRLSHNLVAKVGISKLTNATEESYICTNFCDNGTSWMEKFTPAKLS